MFFCTVIIVALILIRMGLSLHEKRPKLADALGVTGVTLLLIICLAATARAVELILS